MSLLDNLMVKGYLYNSVAWAILPPAMSERCEHGFRLDRHLWAGGVGEGTVSPDGQVSDTWAYQIKLDTSPEAIAEARGILAPDVAGGALGIARMRRFREDAPDPLPGEQRVALEGLDEAHLGDRLTGAILTWHAELHGHGPHRTEDVTSPTRGAKPRTRTR